MFRNLLDEVVRRRLWPLLVVAALIAVAAPLLFLKSAPDDAPTADTAAPAAPATAKLPARAARLLATSDAGEASGHATGSAKDPLLPPASYRDAAASSNTAPSGTAPKSSTSATTTKAKPIPVVIKNADGSSTKSNDSGATTPGSTPAASSKPANTLTARTAAVDVRYGKQTDSKLRRAIPRHQAFYIRGKLVAMFVKYSPSRAKAVFAVAPGIHISGPVKCRVADGACRYLDIPAGSYARLTLLTAKREVVRRRLDVVRIKHASTSGSTSATAASEDNVSTCLLRKLVMMKPGAALLSHDACSR